VDGQGGAGRASIPEHLASAAFLEETFREGIKSGEFREGLDPRLAALVSEASDCGGNRLGHQPS